MFTVIKQDYKFMASRVLICTDVKIRRGIQMAAILVGASCKSITNSACYVASKQKKFIETGFNKLLQVGLKPMSDSGLMKVAMRFT